MKVTRDNIPQNIYNNWQRIVNLLEDLIEVPSALIMRVNRPYIEVFNASNSEENPFSPGDRQKLAGLYCEEVMERKEKLMVPNALKESRWMNNPDLKYDMISYLGFPLVKPDGQIWGTLCVTDTEERNFQKKHIETLEEFKNLIESQLENLYLQENLKKIKNLTQTTLDSLTNNIAILDDRGIIRYVNRQWKKFARNNNLDPDTVDVGTDYLKVCRESRGKWSEEAPEALRGIKQVMEGEKDIYTLEYPCHSPQEKRWFVMKVTPFKGTGPYSVVISHENITERELVKRELSTIKERLEMAIEGANLGIWDWNIETGDISFNKEWARMLGYHPETLEQSIETWKNMIHEQDRDRVSRELDTHLRGDTDYYECEHRVQTKNGDYLWIKDIGRVFKWDDSGRPLRAVGIHQNINDRKEKEERIQYLSFHDGLTGLFNRRFFENEIEILNEARKLPLSIIIGDMDGLKYINDNYGHKTGDEYIKMCAVIFQTVTRSEDIVARIGGDEFAVVLPYTDSQIAHQLCERIHNQRNQINNEEKLPEPLSISLGQATMTDTKQDLNEVFHKADQKMYKNKFKEE